MTKKTYKVVGTQRVFGAGLGEEVKAALSEEQERYYVEGGHLEVVPVEGSPDDDPDSHRRGQSGRHGHKPPADEQASA